MGELCALKESDLTESGGYLLNVSKTYYNPNNNIQEYQLVTPKTKTSRRKIDIDSMVMQSLKNAIEINEVLKIEAGKEYHDKGYIFVNRNKYPGFPFYPKKSKEECLGF